MTDQIDGESIKRLLLEEIRSAVASTPPYLLSSHSILTNVKARLNATNDVKTEQAILTSWHDLFREGHISWGVTIQSPDPPFFHLTSQGRTTLEKLSRDPANPDGYLSHLSKQGPLNPVAASYLKEALATYNSNCFKASAVMVGAAAETLALEVSTALVNRIQGLGRTPLSGLRNWKIKTVLDTLQSEIDKQKTNMPVALREMYDANWSSFCWHIRVTRNDAGHPKSVDPITPEQVHAALLIFPQLMKLNYDLISWISVSYS